MLILLIKYKAGEPVIGAIGIKGDDYRLEAAVGYQSSDAVPGNFESVPVPFPKVGVSMTSYMANYYWDIIEDKSLLTPYMTGGIGLMVSICCSPPERRRDCIWALSLSIGKSSMTHSILFSLPCHAFPG